ncbi:MAG: helix-turn-helix domain-containing protein [Treponema sp.]|nr:helix-turn-helix domain-containing protein [Treponema sp.]
MVIQKITQHYDTQLSKEIARLALNELPVVVSYYTNETNTRSVVHSHSYQEIVYNVSGSNVLYSSEGKQFTLRKGDVIFFPSEQFHSGIFNITDNHSVRLVVQISMDVWKKSSERTKIEWGDEPFVIESGTVAKWDLRGLFERMAQTAYVAKDSQMMIFESQVLELQLLVDQYLKENTESSFRAKNDIVNRAVKYLQQNYSNPAFSVDELAGNVCVSRAHLSRVFKAYTMESVHEYLTDLRLQKCRQLIAEGHSILDSSIESGFSDYTSFVKTFKKMYGMTPQQFRKNLLEEIKKGTGKK